MHVLIVDDQRSARRLLRRALEGLPELQLSEAADRTAATGILDQGTVDVALLDLRLDDQDARNRDGLELVTRARERGAVPIVVTAFSEMEEVRAAMRRGAHDYILKDQLSPELVVPLLEQLRSRRALEEEVVHLRARDAVPSLDELVGASTAMQRLRQQIRQVAPSDRPVLILGPTGSGKELVAQAVHRLGAHPEAPLLDLNCGAIPEPLIEATLFGHAKGAFTGAGERRDGYFAAAGRGTLFLDEIAELPLPLQAKLLRVLESRRYRPIGSTEEVRFDGRVVAATHAELAARVSEGRFREDLFYRLDVLTLRVPALAERSGDLPALVAHLIGRQGRRLQLTSDAIALLEASPWPGNVRQLANVIDRLAVFTSEPLIDAPTLAPFLHGPGGGAAPAATLAGLARTILTLPVDDKLEAMERALIDEAMRLAGGNKSAAGRLLGLHRRAIERRLGPTGEPRTT